MKKEGMVGERWREEVGWAVREESPGWVVYGGVSERQWPLAVVLKLCCFFFASLVGA